MAARSGEGVVEVDVGRVEAEGFSFAHAGAGEDLDEVGHEFKPYLDDRWNQGCTNAWKAWEEIVPLGYTGSYQRVRA